MRAARSRLPIGRVSDVSWHAKPHGFVVTIMFESTSMSRHALPLTVITLFAAAPAVAQTQGYAPQVYAPRVYATQVETPANVRYAAAPQRQMGGGFFEFLFNGTGESPRARRAVPADPYVRDPYV